MCWAGIPVGCWECGCSLWHCCRCTRASPVPFWCHHRHWHTRAATGPLGHCCCGLVQTSPGPLWRHCHRCARAAPGPLGRCRGRLARAAPRPLWHCWHTWAAPRPLWHCRPRHALPLSHYWAGVSGSVPVGRMTSRLLSAMRGFRAALPPRGLGHLKFPGIPSCWVSVLGRLHPAVGSLSLLDLQKALAFLLSQGRWFWGPAHRFCFSISVISSTQCTLCLCSGCGFLQLVV